MSSLLTYLQRMLGRAEEVSAADEQLLTRFAHGRDEAAFEDLVQRYGPLVFGVCRRLLANTHDAEDAFQATFLVLARKAASVGKRELVGHWLYGVACRIARKARAKIARRSAHEKQASALPDVEPVYEMNPPQLGELFDQEVARLPRKYRLPVVLCYLEGKPKGEIARQLGWPEGTVSARLTRAREMLRHWLTRKAVSLPAGTLATVLTPEALSAALPPGLAASTAKAAGAFAAGAGGGLISASTLALAKGAMRSMFLQRMRIPLAVLFVAGLGALVALAYPRDAERNDAPAAEGPNPPAAVAQDKRSIKLYVAGAGAPRPGVYMLESTASNADVLNAAAVDLGNVRAQGQVAYLIQLWPGATGTPVGISGELTKMLNQPNERSSVVSDWLPKDPKAPSPRLMLWIGSAEHWDFMQRSTRRATVIAGKDAEQRAAELQKQGVPARAVTGAEDGFWPVQYEELMRLAEKAEAAKKWPGGESWLAGAVDDAQLRKLVHDFVQACLADDEATFGKLYPGRSPRGLKSTIADLKQLAAEGARPGQSHFVEVAHDRAIVVSDFFAFRKGMRCLVYDLRRDKGGWIIRDIDVRDVEGLVNEIRQFDRRKSAAK